jgi:hypothetical protein
VIFARAFDGDGEGGPLGDPLELPRMSQVSGK